MNTNRDPKKKKNKILNVLINIQNKDYQKETNHGKQPVRQTTQALFSSYCLLHRKYQPMEHQPYPAYQRKPFFPHIGKSQTGNPLAADTQKQKRKNRRCLD